MKKIIIGAAVIACLHGTALAEYFPQFSSTISTTIEERLQAADEAMEEEDYDYAIAITDWIIKQDPKNIPAWAIQSMSFMRQGKYMDADRAWRVTIDLAPDNNVYRVLAAKNIIVAVKLGEAAGVIGRGKLYCDDALKLNPGLVDAKVAKIELLMLEDKILGYQAANENAIRLCNEILVLTPKNETVLELKRQAMERKRSVYDARKVS